MDIRNLLAVLAIAIVAGCGGNEYPTEAKVNFIQACLANGGGQAVCGCELKKIQKKYSFDDFLIADTAARRGDYSHPLIRDLQTNIARECVISGIS